MPQSCLRVDELSPRTLPGPQQPQMRTGGGPYPASEPAQRLKPVEPEGECGQTTSCCFIQGVELISHLILAGGESQCRDLRAEVGCTPMPRGGLRYPWSPLSCPAEHTLENEDGLKASTPTHSPPKAPSPLQSPPPAAHSWSPPRPGAAGRSRDRRDMPLL